MTSIPHTAVSHSQLVSRALEFLAERRHEHPDEPLAVLLDEAGARFNLSPADAITLEHVLGSEPASADYARGHHASALNPAGE